jgi:hypothetical protein
LFAATSGCAQYQEGVCFWLKPSANIVHKENGQQMLAVLLMPCPFF